MLDLTNLAPAGALAYRLAMAEAIIGIGAVAVLLAVGFYLTRGGGGVPGGSDDPALDELRRRDEMGDRLPEPGADSD